MTEAKQEITNVLKKTKIPSKYAKMGVEMGFRPPDPLHITGLLMARSGYGKTTFVSSMPQTLMVTFGPNDASSVVGARAARVHVRSWPEWEKLRNELIADAKGTKPFEMIVLDTVDGFFPLAADFVMDRYNTRGRKGEDDPYAARYLSEVGSGGKGYGDVAVTIGKELDKILNAGYGWFVTGHLAEKSVDTDDGGKITVLRPVVADSTMKVLVRKAYLRAGIEVETIKTRVVEKKLDSGKILKKKELLDKKDWIRQRKLVISTDPTIDEVKMRLPNMPAELDLPRFGGWDVLANAFDEAVAKSREEDEKLSTEKSE